MADIIDFQTGLHVSTFNISADLTDEEREALVTEIINSIYGEEDEDDS